MVICLLGGVLFWQANTSKEGTKGVDIVVFGDSLLGQIRGADSVPDLLAQKTGLQVQNAALGGTSMARAQENRRMDDHFDVFSMVSLTHSVVTGDFRVQNTKRVFRNATEYFESTIGELATVDFEQVSTVFIGQGLNDYHDGVRITNPENPSDEYTYTGALRKVITELREAYPNLRLILVTPTYTWYLSKEMTCEKMDTGYGVLEDYVTAQIATARELDVEIIDLYHDYYPNASMEDWETYTVDGAHPNEAGREKIATTLAAYLQEHPSK